MKRFIITVIGPNRLGIVAAVTKVLYEHGCNIEDSCMTKLQDGFTIMLIMSAPDGIDVESFDMSMKEVEASLGLTIQLKEMGREVVAKSLSGNHMITVYGSDRPGIIYRISEALAKRDIGITDLKTKIVRGGETDVYIMLIEAFYPEDVEEKEVEDDLHRLGESIGATVQVKPIEPYEPF